MAADANGLGVSGSSPVVGMVEVSIVSAKEQVNSQNGSMVDCNEVSAIVKYEEINDYFRHYPELFLLTKFVQRARDSFFPKHERNERALDLIKTAHDMRDKKQPIWLIWICIIWKIVCMSPFLLRILEYLIEYLLG